MAQELKAHGFKLFYYDNKKKGEVEFLIDDYNSLSVMPIEVKSGKDYKVHSALDGFISIPDYHIGSAIVLSNERSIELKGRCWQQSRTYDSLFCVANISRAHWPNVLQYLLLFDYLCGEYGRCGTLRSQIKPHALYNVDYFKERAKTIKKGYQVCNSQSRKAGAVTLNSALSGDKYKKIPSNKKNKCQKSRQQPIRRSN